MSEAELAKTPAIDYLRPIIADADTGHGGLTAVMKLAKMFVERGAAGIHIEDQAPAQRSAGTSRARCSCLYRSTSTASSPSASSSTSWA